jgi:hypothetical protein
MTTYRVAVRIVLTGALCLGTEAVIYACPICFQIEDAHATSGIRAGVGVLMGVTGVVLVGFARFAARVAGRDAAAQSKLTRHQ